MRKSDDLIKEDRKFFAEAFWDKVRETSLKGTGFSIRETLIRSTYPEIFMDNREHPVFCLSDKEWVDRWKEVSMFLPIGSRPKKRPKFPQFVEMMKAIHAQDGRDLRIGQLLVNVSGNAQCNQLYRLESSCFKLGWI